MDGLLACAAVKPMERGVRAEEPREGEMVDPSYDTSQAAVMAKGAENRPGRRGWG